MNSGSSAIDLYNCLKRVISEKNIPFTNLIGFISDSCNVMFGNHNSVYSLLKADAPNIVCIKCSCHLIHLAASKACMILPRSVEDLLRNVGSHFSRSAGRQERFKDFQEFFKTDIHRILLPSNTRWLSLKQCVDRTLEQYNPLEAYFREEVFRDPSKTTEDILNTFANKFNIVYLEFMSYTLGLLTEFNILFQSETALLYKLKPETATLLRTLCANFMKREKTSNKNVFDLNHKNPDFFCSLDQIYLGIAANESIADLKNNASENEVTLFLKNCLQFYIELVSQIKKRFVFDDDVFDIVSIVDPMNAQSFSVRTLAKVTKRFPILKECINCQELDNEWRDHAHIDFKEMGMDPTKTAEEYWKQVFEFRNRAGVAHENITLDILPGLTDQYIRELAPSRQLSVIKFD
ncbi:unnamed protein product [Brassicogethes aeneus]|uniref:Uncharacterized protein n=1 Tax=Brassicogethes aeneus TaxID=1431903 RepID=A0A9P0FBK1_BRAAE|nr:unnamed protein product [Brassicogethes aeneus]